MSRIIRVAQAVDLPPGKAMAVEASGKRIALFNVGGKYFAIDDTCTHEGAPLCEGTVERTIVTCPWHAAMFDLTSGEALSPPADRDVTVYPVRVEDGQIKIELP